MALRDQPYIPLYVQDFLTDEKLNECSAESVGVYIMLMCVMHKSKEYGTILLRQKDRQKGRQISDFAEKLTKHLPFDFATIERSLTELLDEGVLSIDGDTLYQKRMVKDGQLSEKRAAAGKKGADITNAKDFAAAKQSANPSANVAAKQSANSEIEIEYENETVIDSESEEENEDVKKPRRKKPSSLSKTQEFRFNRFWASYPRKVSIGDAEKAWAKISPNEELTDTILAAVDTAKRCDSRFREIKYTPHPATWLNARSWENQYNGPEDTPPSSLHGSNGRPDTLGVLEQMLNEEGGDRR